VVRPARSRTARVPSGFPASSLRRRLADWYSRHARRLPWRGTRDPYRIWVSEVMLQQTQVATVVPYYRRFLERFPTLRALAAAPAGKVLAAWSGLGYYRRAVALHAAAREVRRRFGGRIPADPLLLRTLTGVGDYTAGALSSIAFGLREPALDGNALRVLSRILALRGDPKSAANRRVMEGTARRLLEGGAPPGDINQALMELGARICLPASPRCMACPVRGDCRARARGLESVLPETSRGRRPVDMEAAVALVKRGGAYLMVRREGEGLMEGLWEFPGGFLVPGEDAEKGLARIGRERLGAPLKALERVASIRQAITYRRVKVSAYRATLSEPPPSRRRPGGAVRWVRPGELRRLPHGSATRRILERLGPEQPARAPRAPEGRR